MFFLFLMINMLLDRWRNVIIYSIMSFILVAIIVWSLTSIFKNQTKWDKKFSNVTDMGNCPETAKYFSNFQGTFGTLWFGLVSASASALIMLLIGLSMNFISKNVNASCDKQDIIRPHILIVLTLVIFLLTFISVYKCCACILARLCYQGCMK
jgi:predicted Na+-dependent transporter